MEMIAGNSDQYHIQTSTDSFSNVSACIWIVITTNIDVNNLIYAIQDCFKIITLCMCVWIDLTNIHFIDESMAVQIYLFYLL